MRPLALVPAEVPGVGLEPLAAQQCVENDQPAQVALAVGGERGGNLAHGARLLVCAERVDPPPVVGRAVRALVERVVDDQSPGVGDEGANASSLMSWGSRTLAVDHLDATPAAAPHEVGVVDVLVAGGDLELFPQQPLDHQLAGACGVEVARRVQDAVELPLRPV